MKKKIVVGAILLFCMISIYFFQIEKKYNMAMGERAAIQGLHKQLELNNEAVSLYRDGLVSKKGLNNSLNSLNNTYQIYAGIMWTLGLQESSRFHDIQYIWDQYWNLTTEENLTADKFLEMEKLTNRVNNKLSEANGEAAPLINRRLFN
jgi:hypothetical protein